MVSQFEWMQRSQTQRLWIPRALWERLIRTPQSRRLHKRGMHVLWRVEKRMIGTSPQ